MAVDGVGFLREYLRGFQSYQQAGTDIPSRKVRTDYGQEQAGPLVSEQLISMDPELYRLSRLTSIPLARTGAIEELSNNGTQAVSSGRTSADQIQRDMPLIRAKLGLKGV